MMQSQSEPTAEDKIKEYAIRMARENFIVFTKALMANYQPTWFHMKDRKSVV